MDVENPKGASLSVFFGIVRLFQKKRFSIKVPIHQNLEILKSFCYFRALDMAPTWAVPGLFFQKMKIIQMQENFEKSCFLSNPGSIHHILHMSNCF